VSPRGLFTFMVRYRVGSRWRRLTIGNMPPQTLKTARVKAEAYLRAVEDGEDPAITARQLRRAAVNVEGLVEDFLASREAKKWRPKTKAEFSRLLHTEVVPVIGTFAPDAVTRGAVRELVERIADGTEEREPAPYVANRVLQVLKLMWAWAVDREHVKASPLVGLKRPTEEKPRDIEYSDQEIRAVLKAAHQDAPGSTISDLADLISLLFYTAARLEEVLGLRWSEVDFDRAEWRLPPERSKIGRKKPRARIIPLTAPAVVILKRRKASPVVSMDSAKFVFPAARLGRPPKGEKKKGERKVGHLARPTKALSALKLAAKVPEFMPHGIRHTIRARLARLGVAPHVAELVLGHALRGMEAQYTGTGVEFLAETRNALTAWADELERIKTQTKSDIA
jgi:integrase